MAKQQFQHKIIWLASYPKSGNTWFRAFLTALLGQGEVEINNMKTDGIFSSRDLFERISDIDSYDLYDDEVKLMLPDVFRTLAMEREPASILKIHDAFTRNAKNDFIVPSDVTHCAVYFIRNPLDIAGSLANHNNSSIDEAIKLMNNTEGCLARQENNLNKNNQTKQLMLDWSGHVTSWSTLPSFPVYFLRYEDMLADTFNSFKNMLSCIGWHYADEEIQKAINASSFEVLSNQEKSKGFYEKNIRSKIFFRSGKMGNWKNELTDAQVKTLVDRHRQVMSMYNYVP